MKNNLFAKRIISAGAAALLLALAFTALSMQAFADDPAQEATKDIIFFAGSGEHIFKYEVYSDKPYVTDFLIEPDVNAYGSYKCFYVTTAGILYDHRVYVDVIEEKSGKSVYNFEFLQNGSTKYKGVGLELIDSSDPTAGYVPVLKTDSRYRLKFSVDSDFEGCATGVVTLGRDYYPETRVIARRETLKQLGAILGDSEFALDENSITRAEAARLVYTLYSSDKDELAKTEFTAFGEETKMFDDLDISNPLHEYMHKLGCAGIVVGDGDGNCRPDDIITENEAAAMVLRALGSGYAHEAEEIGYPDGYTNKAIEAYLLYYDIISPDVAINEYMINLLYAALDIPKSRFDSEKNCVIISDVTYRYFLQNK